MRDAKVVGGVSAKFGHQPWQVGETEQPEIKDKPYLIY